MNTKEKVLSYLKAHEEIISGENLAQKIGVSRTAIWKAIRELEKQGYHIEHQKTGYRLLASDVIETAALSNPYLPNSAIYYSESVDSTMHQAKQAAISKQTDFALFVAEEQTQGHGRFGRSFFSPKGQIYMSLLLSPNQHFQELPQYTVLSAVAVSQAIEQLTGLNTQIKWVNDIYIEGKKVCGILTEAMSDFETQRISHVIIGIGLNFCIDPSQIPVELQPKICALYEKEPDITRNELIQLIWQNFFDLIATLPSQEYLKIYREKSYVLGKIVHFSQNGQNYSGKACAITDQGELVVNCNGQEKVLSSGEISLSQIEN